MSSFDTATYTSFLRRPSSFYTAAESTATYSCVGIHQDDLCHFKNFQSIDESIYDNEKLNNVDLGYKDHSYVNGDFQRRLAEEEERLRKEVIDKYLAVLILFDIYEKSLKLGFRERVFKWLSSKLFPNPKIFARTSQVHL